MHYDVIVIFTVVLILISLQLTLNKILFELREIKKILEVRLWYHKNGKE